MEFTGERHVPGKSPWVIEADHLARYEACVEGCRGARVLDAACGTGYGSAVVGRSARAVVGVDIDSAAVEYALQNFATPKVTFEVASVTALPFEDDSFDAITSFETLEHLGEHDQRVFIGETRRLLGTEGVLFISTPDARTSRRRGNENEFHILELERDAFEALLREEYANVQLYYQSLWVYSELLPVDRTASVELPPADWGQNVIAVCSDGPLPDVTFLVRTPRAFQEARLEALQEREGAFADELRERESAFADSLQQCEVTYQERLSERERQAQFERSLDLQRLAERYETSTSWRVTGLLRWARRVFSRRS